MPSLIHQLIGDTQENERRESDFYATPDYAIDALLEREKFDGPVWEPCCGDGAISKRLLKYGYIVKSTDLNDHGYGKPGVDFLKTREPFKNNIVTNPPFDIGTQITLHALNVATKKVAIFHKVAFLEGKERREKLFNLKKLETVYVFTNRVGFVIPGQVKHKGGMMAFAWFVFNHDYNDDPRIKWI